MYSHDFQSLADKFYQMVPAYVTIRSGEVIHGYISALDVRSGRFSMIGLTMDEFHDDLAISDVIMVDDTIYPIEAGKSICIYVDDERRGHPDKDNEIIVKSVKEAEYVIEKCREVGAMIECIDLDHDLGNYEPFGGDAINLVYYLVENEFFYPITLHTANSTGHDNMQQVIDRYWSEKESAYNGAMTADLLIEEQKEYEKEKPWGPLHGDFENTKRHLTELCEEAIAIKKELKGFL